MNNLNLKGNMVCVSIYMAFYKRQAVGWQIICQWLLRTRGEKEG